jgi:hypothetical protein
MNALDLGVSFKQRHRELTKFACHLLLVFDRLIFPGQGLVEDFGAIIVAHITHLMDIYRVWVYLKPTLSLLTTY